MSWCRPPVISRGSAQSSLTRGGGRRSTFYDLILFNLHFRGAVVGRSTPPVAPGHCRRVCLARTIPRHVHVVDHSYALSLLARAPPGDHTLNPQTPPRQRRTWPPQRRRPPRRPRKTAAPPLPRLRRPSQPQNPRYCLCPAMPCPISGPISHPTYCREIILSNRICVQSAH